MTSMEKSSQLAERLSYILGNIMNMWSYNVKVTLIDDFYGTVKYNKLYYLLKTNRYFDCESG